MFREFAMTPTLVSSINSMWTVFRRVFCTIAFPWLLAPALWGAGSCDLNSDGQVNVVDVQMGVNQSLGVESCSSADINSDGQCNVVDVQLLVNTALGSGCPTQLSDSSPPAGPWVTGFSPKRIHYVDDIACGGAGTIGNPECSSTALSTSHYQPGDLHIFREGLHHNSTATLSLSKNCTQSTPCVFKGYVDGNGQPERARFNAEVNISGTWTWFFGLEVSQDSLFSSAGDKTNVTLSAAGARIINSIIHDSWQRNNIAAWNNGPGQVVYGNVIYRPAVHATAQPTGHNIYTQNTFSAYGWKYYIQNISMERAALEGSALFQARTGADEDNVSGFHLEANLFAEGPDNRIQMEHMGGSSWRRMHTQVWKNNYFLNFASGSGRGVYANSQPFQGEITGNYFAKTTFSIQGYWGNAGAHNPFIFTGNELYDPAGGYHIRHFATAGASGSEGSHKFPNQDVWNNNTFGGTFKATLHCNGTNFGERSLAQWRTATNNCRVTPSAGDANGFDVGSKVVANPTVNKVVVLKNEYQCSSGCPFTDQARGNIYIANWANSANQTVNISPVVGPSKQYVVRYARDFFGPAAASGTCPSSGACNVSLPIRRSSSGGTIFTGAYVITAEP